MSIKMIALDLDGTTLTSRREVTERTLEAFRRADTDHKKLIVYPPMFPSRPYAWYHDEGVRWFDYWTKNEDNGVMDEPPVKIFVMGINKWKFEEQWPPADTEYTGAIWP